jgi:hypothetical protein
MHGVINLEPNISCLDPLNDSLGDKRTRGMEEAAWASFTLNNLRVFYLELLVVVGLADGGGVPAKPLKKLLPDTLGMFHDSKVSTWNYL